VDLHIRGNDIVITDDLRAFAERRAAKLDPLLSRVVEAKLELRRRHNRSGGDSTTAQLTIQTGRRLLRAEEHAPDPTAAIDQAVDKLLRQIRRYHDKRTDRKGHKPADALVAATNGLADVDDEALDDEADESTTELVRTKRFSVKPMDIDEAIDQMELLGHDFYLFHNALEQQLNVLYRRRDGTYGLLAPETR